MVTHCRLQSETDIKVYQQKLRDAEKAADELTAKIAKKERECEVRLAEKVAMRSWKFSKIDFSQCFVIFIFVIILNNLSYNIQLY